MKFFIKIKIVTGLRSLFLFIFGRRANIQNWENRILVVYFEAIGDTVALTSILKHFRSAFPGREIYFLISSNLGLDRILSSFVDKIILLNYRRFISNPIYAFAQINQLRKIGYKTVLSPDHSPAEVIGKSICVCLGAREVVGYEGFLLPFEKAFDNNMKKNIEFVKNKINPQFTKIIPSIDRTDLPKNGLNSVILHYIKFYEALTGNRESNYAPEIKTSKTADEKITEVASSNHIIKNNYAVINLGSSQIWKNWPVERFLEVSSLLNDNKIPIILVGSKNEEGVAQKFQKDYPGKCLNLVGQTSISEVVSLINSCRLVIANDTSPIHIGVALKKPTLCILGGGHFGQISLYGYSDINHWIYKRTECFGDNWQCVQKIKSRAIAPCIDAVKAEDVSSVLGRLLKYIESTPSIPKEKFSPSFISVNQLKSV